MAGKEAVEPPVKGGFSREDSNLWNRWKSLLHYSRETGEIVWQPRAGRSDFNGRFAGQRAGHINPKSGYCYVTLERKSYLAHRLAWFLETGEWPEQVDHIDGDRSNNRWPNLRNVSSAENHRNMAIGAHNTSGYMGVCWDASRAKWMATARNRDGRSLTLGRFKNKSDAIAARQAALIEHGYHENHGRGSVG